MLLDALAFNLYENREKVLITRQITAYFISFHAEISWEFVISYCGVFNPHQTPTVMSLSLNDTYSVVC